MTIDSITGLGMARIQYTEEEGRLSANELRERLAAFMQDRFPRVGWDYLHGDGADPFVFVQLRDKQNRFSAE